MEWGAILPGMTLPPLSFDQWDVVTPVVHRGDPLWNVRMFRMATYLAGRARSDTARLGRQASLGQADQLVRAVGSIAANIAEGYSRDTPQDRRRFYVYALGSTREALTWIGGMGPAVTPSFAEYEDLLVQIRRQLLTTLKRIGRPAVIKQSGPRSP